VTQSLVCTRTVCARKRCKLNRVVTVPLFTFRKHVISKPKFLLVQYTRYKHLYQTLRLPLLCNVADMLHRSLCGCCFVLGLEQWSDESTRLTSGLSRKSRSSVSADGQQPGLSYPPSGTLGSVYVVGIFLGRNCRHPSVRLAFLS
jgi:hypothetical protein